MVLSVSLLNKLQLIDSSVIVSAGSSSLYLFGCGDTSVYEVKAFTEDFRSWFVGQTVQRGKLTLQKLNYPFNMTSSLLMTFK